MKEGEILDYLKILSYDECYGDLFKSNGEYVGRLLVDWFSSIEGKLTDTSTITYKIPSTLTVRGGAVEPNPVFDIVKAEMLLEVQGVVYVIKDIKKVEGTTTYKEIKGYSREVKLTKRDVILSDNLKQIYSDDINVADGVINDLETATTWSMGYLDEEARVDGVNGGNMPKYRYFEETEGLKWLDYLRNGFAEAFDALVLFNTKEKKVDIYNEETFGDHSGLTLAIDNFIKEINITRNTNELVTRLYCNVEGMYITENNPTGQNYIENFSYFIENELMSEELINALLLHEEMVEDVSEDLVYAQEELKQLRIEEADLNATIAAQEEEMVGLKSIQSAYIKAEDNENLANISKKIDELEIKINQTIRALQEVQFFIERYLGDIEYFASALSRETVVDREGNRIFTDELLDEIDEYIFEEDFIDTIYTNEEELYKGMVDTLKEKCYPTVSIDITSSDFIKYINRNVVIHNELKLGDYITAVSDRFGEFEMRVMAYSMSKNNLKLTLANSTLYQSNIVKVVDAISQLKRTRSTINKYKSTWETASNQSTFVSNLMSRGIDLSSTRMSGTSTKNKIMVLESGMYIIDAENEDNQLYLGSSLIAFTDNKWRTSSIGVDKDGIVAQSLTGRIALGENISIGSSDGSFHIDDNAMTVRAEDGTVRCLVGKTAYGEFGIRIFDDKGKELVLSEKGMLQRYSFVYSDNLDSNYPLEIPITLDDDIIDIRDFSLDLKIKPFRTYANEVYKNNEDTIKTSIEEATNEGLNHTHNTTIEGHSHLIKHEIKEINNSCTLDIFVNDVVVERGISENKRIAITKYLNKGDNVIKIKSSALVRVVIQVNGKVFSKF